MIIKEIDVKNIMTKSNLPVADFSVNPYVGCSHACRYCYASFMKRFTNHPEPWGEFVDVKYWPEIKNPGKYAGKEAFFGSVTDCYQPCEKKYGRTRALLEQLSGSGISLSIATKSDLVLRDLDLFSEINDRTKAVLELTLTTYDENLCRILEPHVCTTARRYEVLKAFQRHGIPTVVWMTPFLPFINDTEENLRGLLEYCFDAGVRGILTFGFGLTLRDGDREYFYAALDRHFPGLKQRYHQTYGYSYEIPSPNRDRLYRIFDEACEQHGVLYRPDEIFRFLHEFPQKTDQMSLF